MVFCRHVPDRDACADCDLTEVDARRGALCPKLARCRCGSLVVFPIEIYGESTRYVCGACGSDVELHAGAVVKPHPLARPAKVTLPPTPLEQWMTSEAHELKAEDLLALRNELLAED